VIVECISNIVYGPMFCYVCGFLVFYTTCIFGVGYNFLLRLNVN
jgi:hypothetical protein